MSGRALHEPSVIVPHGGPEELLGLGAMRVDGPRAVNSMATGPWLRGVDGQPSAGSLGVLLDDVLGQAIHLRYRPPNSWSVTTELSIDFRTPPPIDGSRITADATALDTDPAGGLAHGRAVDEHGRLLAIATTWHRYVPGIPGNVIAPPPVSSTVERGASLCELLGVWPGTVVAGCPQLRNAQGSLHGGVVATLAEVAGTHALAAPELVTESLRVTYLRPANGDIAFDALVLHRGRSFGVVQVVATGSTGKPCAHAIMTYRSLDAAA